MQLRCLLTVLAVPLLSASLNYFRPACRPVQYWRTGGKAREFPELSSGSYGIPHIQAKPNFGVAIGGGGYRAATLASGWIRGLHNISHPDDSKATILSKTKYLSTISGSSW